MRYLARYVARTAISDERLVEANDDRVTFRYRDSASGQSRQVTLQAEEFMRRYLQHVLPPGLHRVRYFGWLHPAAKLRRAIVDTLLAVVIVVRPPSDQASPWHLCCPHCQRVSLVFIEAWPAPRRDLPAAASSIATLVARPRAPTQRSLRQIRAARLFRSPHPTLLPAFFVPDGP